MRTVDNQNPAVYGGSINVGGYIGDSTKNEVAYARRNGKKVRWLEGTEPV